MPTPIEDFISISAVPEVSIRLEPVQNALYSLLLLYLADNISGLGDWVQRTTDAMSPEEHRTHSLVMIGFHYAITPERSWASFPAYLDHLAALEPEALVDRMLTVYASKTPKDADFSNELDPAVIADNKDSMLASLDEYLSFLRERFCDNCVDVEIETQAYEYVMDPPAMQSLIVTHLRHMWEKYLAAEWERVSPMLLDSVRAFAQIDFSQMSKLEAGRFITGQEMEKPKWQKCFDKAESLVFVPNAHVGPYMKMFKQGETYGVVFGARLPEGSQIYAPDLSRTEILVRLNAMADDYRLRILKFVSENGEQRSQDIMLALNLSQSAASRHLKQLSATGILSERRCEGAKCYTLNPERVDETLQAVAAFLLGEGANRYYHRTPQTVIAEPAM